MQLFAFFSVLGAVERFTSQMRYADLPTQEFPLKLAFGTECLLLRQVVAVVWLERSLFWHWNVSAFDRSFAEIVYHVLCDLHNFRKCISMSQCVSLFILTVKELFDSQSDLGRMLRTTLKISTHI